MKIDWNLKGKGQIFLGVAAILLIAVGYLNYSNQTNEAVATGKMLDAEEMASIGDATFVSSTATVENEVEANFVQNETIPTSNQEERSIKDSKSEYFTKSRLERDKMYAASLDSYQKIVENTQVSTEQKSLAQEEIQKLNQEKNAVMITENLIQTKGFEEVILFVNMDSISVVVKAEKLTDEQIAQIQNIVSRELKADVEDIHISIK